MAGLLNVCKARMNEFCLYERLLSLVYPRIRLVTARLAGEWTVTLARQRQQYCLVSGCELAFDGYHSSFSPLRGCCKPCAWSMCDCKAGLKASIGE